jgi:hypothetical protein
MASNRATAAQAPMAPPFRPMAEVACNCRLFTIGTVVEARLTYALIATVLH